MKDSDKFSPLASVLTALGALNTTKCCQIKDIVNGHTSHEVVSKTIEIILPKHDQSESSGEDIRRALLTKSDAQIERLQ
jgi:hypothetical protein